MLLDNLQSTIDKIEYIEYAESVQKTLEELNNNIKESKSLYNELDEITDIMDSLSFLLINVEESIKIRLSSDLKSLDYESGEEFRRILRRIKSDIKEINDLYRSNWKKYYSEKYTEIVKVLDLISSIINTSEILVLKNILDSHKSKWPIVKSDLDNLNSKRKESMKVIENLEINDEIETFLIKLSSNEMYIGDLSKEIMSWIEKNNMENKIKMTIE